MNVRAASAERLEEERGEQVERLGERLREVRAWEEDRRHGRRLARRVP
jgi:hypothetical protein